MHSILIAVAKMHYGRSLFPEHIRKLEEVATVTHRQDLARAGEAAIIEALTDSQADIVMTIWQSPKITKAVLDACPKLKYMCHLSGQVGGYVSREAIEAGLLLSNWGNATSHSTAEGAFAMTLALLRHYNKIPFWMRNDRLYWELPELDEEGLFEQRVGLHGLGPIAQEYSKLLGPWNCKVSAYSPHCPDEVFAELDITRANSLEELYGSNRIISCHAANRPDNFHIVNEHIFSLMEDGAYFINTGRGGVVDTEALIAELRTGRIRAALDVFEEEPLPADSELRDLPNCFVVPHRAGPTDDRCKVMGERAVENILRYVNGEELLGQITLARYDTMTQYD